MKTLYIIGGPMGVGKTTVGKELNKMINKCVYLDGDWCWNMNPFIVNDETKRIVEENICYFLNNFINSSTINNIIFTWVLHEQDIISKILSNLNCNNIKVINISLICNKDDLINRLTKDISLGLRDESIINKSLLYLEKYNSLNTIKINTSNKSIEDIAREIINL